MDVTVWRCMHRRWHINWTLENTVHRKLLQLCGRCCAIYLELSVVIIWRDDLTVPSHTAPYVVTHEYSYYNICSSFVFELACFKKNNIELCYRSLVESTCVWLQCRHCSSAFIHSLILHPRLQHDARFLCSAILLYIVRAYIFSLFVFLSVCLSLRLSVCPPHVWSLSQTRVRTHIKNETIVLSLFNIVKHEKNSQNTSSANSRQFVKEN